MTGLCYTHIESPVGDLLVAGADGLLHFLSFPTGHKAFGPHPTWQRTDAPFHGVRRQLEAINLHCGKLPFIAWRAPMASNVERKDHPISMRLPEADIAMIDRAAVLRGRSRTDFVRDAAVRAAEDVLMENRLIRMSPDGFADFLATLSGPPAAVPELVELAARPAPWEPGSDEKR